MFKNAADEDGNHHSADHLREVSWVAIPPVVKAIRVLERNASDGGLLFDAAARRVRKLDVDFTPLCDQDLAVAGFGTAA
ncbi:hypothetical protein ACFVT2_11835 [Streptomyces sp. NPDC058000]|uniref:hypothetical protein n=1 Tax=Streptomyces sp. NPDC058000 TaxID=3346299 RepID=UPI0036E37822